MKFVKQSQSIFSHLVLIGFILSMFLPLYLAFIAASHPQEALMRGAMPYWPGHYFLENIRTVLTKGVSATGGEPLAHMLINSFIMAISIALGKVVLSLTSAAALVYFDFPYKKTAFALIFSTMLLPVEVRIVPTFQVVAHFGWINTYFGLTFPLMASATATFMFQQFFKTLSRDLVDAARLDGAGPLQFFFHILLPISASQIAALFIILFVYGWNQYLWPLVMTTDTSMSTIVMGIRYLTGVADQVPQWHLIMTIGIIALLPPCVVVMMCQRWLEKGLRE